MDGQSQMNSGMNSLGGSGSLYTPTQDGSNFGRPQSETTLNYSAQMMGSSMIDTQIPISIGENEHQLQHRWSFWFLRRVQGARTQDNYEQNVKNVGSFATVEGFWNYYNHMLRPNDLPVNSDYHLFRDNIKPLWEDEVNKQGGKWTVRLKKGLASRCWEDLLFAAIGEQFDVGDEICGVVVSTRFQEDILSVWNRNAENREAKVRIFEKLKAILNIPNITMEYKPHDAAMRGDPTIFRTPSSGGMDPNAMINPEFKQMRPMRTFSRNYP
eukprot:TRINITY_DN660_c0_g2_i1.p1 TRINITY_DN660_c0_g2~~TRINITY_DN660_c0_g2_i1.p1  ORF type:complete len:293 (-),score=34.24 TRINITY_DN660_c0_g2_i1:2-808(-)